MQPNILKRGFFENPDIIPRMATSKMRASALELQDRDRLLLRGLFESRVMTTAHAATLYFADRTDAAYKRLQALKSCGFVGERPRHAFHPSILFLTRKGIKQLETQGILENYPSFDLPALDRRARVSDLTIRHELEVMDVKAAFHSAVKALPSRTIAEFSTWPLLNEFKAYRPGRKSAEVSVKPDGFIVIHETEADGSKFERTFFLELDRSTETQDVLVDRAGCYFDYYRSGGFAMRNGAERQNYKQFTIRVFPTLAGVDIVGHHNLVTCRCCIHRILNVHSGGSPVGVGRRGMGVVEVHVAHGGQGAARGRQQQTGNEKMKFRFHSFAGLNEFLRPSHTSAVSPRFTSKKSKIFHQRRGFY